MGHCNEEPDLLAMYNPDKQGRDNFGHFASNKSGSSKRGKLKVGKTTVKVGNTALKIAGVATAGYHIANKFGLVDPLISHLVGRPVHMSTGDRHSDRALRRKF